MVARTRRATAAPLAPGRSPITDPLAVRVRGSAASSGQEGRCGAWRGGLPRAGRPAACLRKQSNRCLLTWSKQGPGSGSAFPGALPRPTLARRIAARAAGRRSVSVASTAGKVSIAAVEAQRVPGQAERRTRPSPDAGARGGARGRANTSTSGRPARHQAARVVFLPTFFSLFFIFPLHFHSP